MQQLRFKKWVQPRHKELDLSAKKFELKSMIEEVGAPIARKFDTLGF